MSGGSISIMVPIGSDLGDYRAAEASARQAAGRAAAEKGRQVATFGLVERVDRGELRFEDGAGMEIPAGMSMLYFAGETVPR